MSQELKDAFDKLNINDKRDQLSNEFENVKGINPITKVKNYNINNDKNLSESEILTFFYEDVYNIEQELITLLKVIER